MRFKHFLSIGISLFFSNYSYTQVAVLNNKDGFVNVKKEPKHNSKTIYKLKDQEVFLYQQTEIYSNSKWRTVFISKNKYQLECTDEYDKYLIGYIPKNNIYPIENLPEGYIGSQFSFNYKLKKFNTENKVIDLKDKKATFINGRKFYGTNGGIPKVEVVDIEASINNKPIVIPAIFFQDIFECDNEFKVFTNKDDYLVYQWNGYGNAEYLIVWVLGNQKLKQRLILKP